MELPREVRVVLEAAIRAPSGENAQPWRFVIRDGEAPVIDVYISSERENSLYGWGNRASYVAIGAALENIKICAPTVGFDAEINILPVRDEPRHAARVTLRRTAVRHDPLVDAIAQRATNRKPYRTDDLTANEIVALKGTSDAVGYGEVRITSTSSDKKALAEIGSCNERIMLNNPQLHDFFFSHVNWTKVEDEGKKTGFFIDTLELPPPAQIGFKVMRNWRRAKVLNRLLGFNRIASAQNALVYAQAAAFGIIVAPNESVKDAIQSGVLMQRVWLEATRLGLSMQPVVGVLYMAMRVRAGELEGFSEDDIQTIRDCDQEVRSIFSLGEAHSYFMFRVGRADPPSARSIRFPIEEVSAIAI